MRVTVALVVLADTFAVAGCGGGASNHAVAWTPPPPSSPPPAIIAAGTTSQQFAVAGASHLLEGDQTPLLDVDDQLQVRYVQSSNSYEVQLPHRQEWAAIHPVADSTTNFDGAVDLSIRQSLQYSSIFAWGDGAIYSGHEAIGIATPAAGVPVTGSANYSGSFWGQSSEIYSNRPVSTYGGVELSFDFGQGSLSGRILPVAFYYATYDDYGLAPVGFRDTVYSTGSPTFSGKFDTNLAGMNSFSGRFTGPNAQELIGNFSLPYESPMNGATYQADGAFVGKR